MTLCTDTLRSALCSGAAETLLRPGEAPAPETNQQLPERALTNTLLGLADDDFEGFLPLLPMLQLEFGSVVVLELVCLSSHHAASAQHRTASWRVREVALRGPRSTAYPKRCWRRKTRRVRAGAETRTPGCRWASEAEKRLSGVGGELRLGKRDTIDFTAQSTCCGSSLETT